MKLLAFILACIATALAGCDARENAASAIAPSSACAAGESRWASAAGRYERSGQYGAGEGEDLLALGGIAMSGDRVYLLDAGAGSVVVLDGEMRKRTTFGRAGNGPGELARSTMPTSHGGTQRWIAASGDTVVVFDGERVVFFRADGTPGATWSPERVRGSSPMQSRIALAGGEVLFSAGGYDFSRGQGSPVFTLFSTSGARPRQVAALPLPKLPGRPPALSSEQARPRWDARGDCILLSDGASPSLVRVDRASGAADTLPLPLPDRAPPPISDDEQRAAAAAGARGVPEPSAPLRVRDLIIDPDGTVWIRPIQPDPPIANGIEVIRINAGSGEAMTDTLPAFPRAFGPPGTFYAVEATADGAPLLVRYRLVERQI